MIKTTGNGSSAIKSLAEAAVEADKNSRKQKKSMTKGKGKSHVLCTVLASTCMKTIELLKRDMTFLHCTNCEDICMYNGKVLIVL